MIDKTVVITGANRGIGLELCRMYAEAKANVIAVCRNASDELSTLNMRIIDGIDVVRDESVDRLKNELRDISIDLLINNAGVLGRESLAQMDFANMRHQFEVNALGALRVCYALLEQLSAGAKLILITSRMGSMADNSSGGYYGYRMSKAALNAAGVSLARDLKDRAIAIGIFHPGYVQTDMTGHSGDISAGNAAARLVQRINALTLDHSGVFQHANGELLLW